MTLNDFSALGSVVGIFFVAIGLFVSIQQFKLSRTMDYMKHLCDPSVINTRAKVDAWLASSDDDNIRLKALENDHDLHAHVKAFISFCNQVSIAYRFDTLYNEMAFDIWFPFIPNYWNCLHFYILSRREKDFPKSRIPLGHNFEAFAKDILAFQKGKNKYSLVFRIKMITANISRLLQKA
jgi:hypothetical protein